MTAAMKWPVALALAGLVVVGCRNDEDGDDATSHASAPTSSTSDASGGTSDAAMCVGKDDAACSQAFADDQCALVTTTALHQDGSGTWCIAPQETVFIACGELGDCAYASTGERIVVCDVDGGGIYVLSHDCLPSITDRPVEVCEAPPGNPWPICP